MDDLSWMLSLDNFLAISVPLPMLCVENGLKTTHSALLLHCLPLQLTLSPTLAEDLERKQFQVPRLKKGAHLASRSLCLNMWRNPQSLVCLMRTNVSNFFVPLGAMCVRSLGQPVPMWPVASLSGCRRGYSVGPGIVLLFLQADSGKELSSKTVSLEY